MTTLAGPEVQVLPGREAGPSTITVRPLQPTIGAEISGVDLARPLSTEVRDEIKDAILRYKVVFFRDQDLDRDQHAAFARQFGPLYTHPSTSKSYAGTVPAIHDIEPFSSCFGLADLQYVDGLGELAGAPGAAAELAQDAPGLELGVRAFAG